MCKWILAAFAVLLFSINGYSQAPGQPNEGLTGVFDSSSGTFTASWWGKAGRTYFIQQSNDLISWSYIPIIEIGGEAVISWGFTTTAPKMFIKLEGTDIPTSDPANTDFAGDGMTALWKLKVGLDPLVWFNPNTPAPSGDGSTYYKNFLAGTSPFDPAPALTLTSPAAASLVP